MSTRTIFEINHDFAHEIEKDPEGFITALRFYLSSGSGRDAEELERYGFHRAWWGHHSTVRKIVTEYDENRTVRQGDEG